MKQYVCLACGGVFDEDEIATWIENHGLDYGGERWSGSPCCGENYVDAHECDCCGEIITTDKYVEVDDKKYCWDCIIIKPLYQI